MITHELFFVSCCCDYVRCVKLYLLLRKFIPIACIILSLIVCSYNSYGQDVQFSQFYQVPTFQNPAFAGSAHTSRITAHQRIQWPNIDSKYITSFVSFDTYKPQYKSGFGGYIIYDQQGASSISSTQLNLQYSYELHLTRQIAIRMGLQLGWTMQNIDYSMLFYLRFMFQKI